MRNTLQTDRLPHIRPILDHGYNGPVIEFEKRCQHHQRKELVLGEILAAVPTGVGRQRTLGNLDGLPGQRHRRPRHRTCGFHAGMM
jgi:hypothetical protein